MSNIIKLNSHSRRLSVKVSGYGNNSVEEDPQDFYKKQNEDYYSAGFKEGQEKTRREMEKEYSDKLFRKYEEVFNVLQGFDEKFLEYEKEYEELVIETAYELAKKIVQHEIEESPVINENIRIAINKIIGANEVRLKLNPKDIEALTDESKNLIHNSSFNKIKIESDDRIECGGCLIETEIGNVDARISTQLNELKKGLENSLSKKNS